MVNMVGQESLYSGKGPADCSRNSIMAIPQLPENHIRANLLRNIPDEIKGLSYFFPKFTDSKTATKYVEEHAKGPGYFLLRLSSKGNNFLSLSVSIENKSVRHVNVVIERSPGSVKYFIVQQVKFNSFLELQRYYTDHRICNLEQIENVKLLHPINRGFEDIDQYEKVHPPLNGSDGVPIPRRMSDVQMPKTPSSQQLNGQWPDPTLQNNGEQYLPGAQGGEEQIRRKNSNVSRPLPQTPDMKDKGEKRPPCPPPPTKETDLYYSRPRDTNRNRIEELRQILRDAELCDCGVPLCDSELPHGWTLHKSHDAATFGCLFYQSSRGETTWNLPLDIVPDITPHQRNIIVKLSHQSGKAPPKCLMLPYQERQDPVSPGQIHPRGSRSSVSDLQGAEGRDNS